MNVPYGGSSHMNNPYELISHIDLPYGAIKGSLYVIWGFFVSSDIQIF